MAGRALQSSANIVVAHGTQSFPAGLFASPAAAKKLLMGIIEWEHPHLAEKIHLVLENHAKGGLLALERLWDKGHRKVLLVGTETMNYYLERDEDGPCRHGRAFRQEWLRRGGQIEIMSSDHSQDPIIKVDENKLHALFRQPDPPTAVFGLRDVEVVATKTAMRKSLPELVDRMDWIGYGNTPWSFGAEKPFDTVDWSLEKMAVAICEVIAEGLANPKGEKRKILIDPKLVVRD